MINHVASHKQVATNVSFKYGDLGWRRQTQMEGRLFHARWGHRSLLGFEFRRPAWVLLQCTHAHPPLPPPQTLICYNLIDFVALACMHLLPTTITSFTRLTYAQVACPWRRYGIGI
jgi:hypothetical protein